MGYLNKTCSYTKEGKLYKGTIIGEKGEVLLVITTAPFAHNHTPPTLDVLNMVLYFLLMKTSIEKKVKRSVFIL